MSHVEVVSVSELNSKVCIVLESASYKMDLM